MKKTYYIMQKEASSTYPQVDCLSVFQAQQLSAWKMISPVKPSLRFRMKNKAELTDVLSSTAGPFTDFIISPKVKGIIESSHIMQHQYFNAEIEMNKQKYDYYWLHLSQPELIMALDYEKSEFFQTQWEIFDKGPIQIKSFEHYQELKAKDKEGAFGVSLKKIVMTEKFDRTLDLFFLLPFDFNIFISESLKVKLEQNGIRGIFFPYSVTF